MPQAIGHLRYGPRSSTVPRKGRWIILECDRDWFNMLAPQVHRKLPGRWANVVDVDRATSHGRAEARLGLVKQGFQEPAWHPHISITRNETLTGHKDVWDLGVAIGDVQQEMESMVGSGKHHRVKIEELRVELARMGSHTKPKYRKTVLDAMSRSQSAVGNRTTRLKFLQREESRLFAEWERVRVEQDLPDFVQPDGKIQFGVDMDLKRIRSHWYLDVTCRSLSKLRVFFGLEPSPLVPYHLTVAVTSSCPHEFVDV